MLPLIIVVWQDGNSLNAFAWIGVSYVFYVLIPYTLVCVANIFYHLRIARDQFNVFSNLILPLIGIVINVYVFYKNFLKTYFLDATDFTTQSSIFWYGVHRARHGLVVFTAHRRDAHRRGEAAPPLLGGRRRDRDMSGRFAGRNIIVTGGGRGIGQATARQFARRGRRGAVARPHGRRPRCDGRPDRGGRWIGVVANL